MKFDICAMVPTQFFILRDPATENGIAIAEIPKAPPIGNADIIGFNQSELYFTGDEVNITWASKVLLEPTYERYHPVKLKIRWVQFQNNAHNMSDSMGYLTTATDIRFTPLSRHEAETALTCGYLDYFRATEVIKFGGTTPTTVMLMYAGKLEAEGGMLGLPLLEQDRHQTDKSEDATDFDEVLTVAE